ncbi:PP15 [Orf virus]|uniref:PP15 n=1 Tax=Orf virus TaxID=10258 RepID=F1AXG7_ORFV|nr:PP15 [Orf virus]
MFGQGAAAGAEGGHFERRGLRGGVWVGLRGVSLVVCPLVVAVLARRVRVVVFATATVLVPVRRVVSVRRAVPVGGVSALFRGAAVVVERARTASRHQVAVQRH